MATMDCCDNPYSKKFNREKANAEIKDYREKRIKGNSLTLINELKKLPLEDTSVLDIGGGVGVTIFELLKAGVNRAIHVEISEPYANAFCEEANRQGVREKVTSCLGNFTDLHDQLDSCDLVCLDKVICCYPNYRLLTNLSVDRARRWYAYVIPRDVWWVRMGDYLKNLIQSFGDTGFRTYVHPVAEIEKIITEKGFQKVFQSGKGIWLTSIFERTS
jgi:hypothetical protein